MRVGVKILPRKEVLDSQGRTVTKTLQSNKFSVSDCKVGKYLEIEVDASTEQEAMDEVKKMAEFVLYNPLTESYTLEVL